MTFARKINKIPEFYLIFARKMAKFYMMIAREIFPDYFGRGNVPKVYFCRIAKSGKGILNRNRAIARRGSPVSRSFELEL